MALFSAAAVFLTALAAACVPVRGLGAVACGAPVLAFGAARGALGAGATGAVSDMRSSNMASRSSAGGASSLARASSFATLVAGAGWGGYEILATPLTYFIVHRLKRAERADPFDVHTRFSPFRLDG